MEAFDGADVPVEPASDLHQAARVVADDIIRLCFADGLAFDLCHGRGNLGVFDSKSAPESAAGFCLGHFNQFESLNVLEEFAWGLLGAQLPQAVTAVMEGRSSLKTGAQILHSQFVDKKLRKLPGFGSVRLGGCFLGKAVEKLRVKNFEHGPAGTGARENHLSVLKYGQLFSGDGTGFLPIAGVKRGLAAAGLVLRIFNCVAQPLQNAYHRHPNVRIDGVDKAGDKKGNAHV